MLQNKTYNPLATHPTVCSKVYVQCIVKTPQTRLQHVYVHISTSCVEPGAFCCSNHCIMPSLCLDRELPLSAESRFVSMWILKYSSNCIETIWTAVPGQSSCTLNKKASNNDNKSQQMCYFLLHDIIQLYNNKPWTLLSLHGIKHFCSVENEIDHRNAGTDRKENYDKGKV